MAHVSNQVTNQSSIWQANCHTTKRIYSEQREESFWSLGELQNQEIIFCVFEELKTRCCPQGHFLSTTNALIILRFFLQIMRETTG